MSGLEKLQQIKLYEMQSIAYDVGFYADSLDNDLVGSLSSMSLCDEALQAEAISREQRTPCEKIQALYKMCDTNASDPDSPMFDCFPNDLKKKRKASMIKHCSDVIAMPKTAVYKEVKKSTHELDDERPITGIDVTQLEDIKESSLLLENMFIEHSTLRASSDIEETSGTSCSNASQAVPTEVSSTYFETLFDSAISNNGAGQCDLNEKVENFEHTLYTTEESGFEVSSDDGGLVRKIKNLTQRQTKIKAKQPSELDMINKESCNSEKLPGSHANTVDALPKNLGAIPKIFSVAPQKNTNYLKLPKRKDKRGSSYSVFRKPSSVVKDDFRSPPHADEKPVVQWEALETPASSDILTSSEILVTPANPSVKAKVASCQNIELAAFRELEQESGWNRLKYCDSFGSVDTSKLFESKNTAASLPKKAYISSELKQVADQRSQLNIDGGETALKLILSSLLNTIVLHDGRLAPSATPATWYRYAESMVLHMPHAANSSLVVLPVMPGDMSMDTNLNARSF